MQGTHWRGFPLTARNPNPELLFVGPAMDWESLPSSGATTSVGDESRRGRDSMAGVTQWTNRSGTRLESDVSIVETLQGSANSTYRLPDLMSGRQTTHASPIDARISWSPVVRQRIRTEGATNSQREKGGAARSLEARFSW
jgi:hypothetical protein